MSFVHLHVHSDYSLLDGIGSCAEYASKILMESNKEGKSYLAITDHGMMAAVPAQTKACQDHGLIPVYGVEVYLNDYQHLVEGFKDLEDEDKERTRSNFHLVLWARDNQGYKNLVQITSDAWINGFYYKARTNKKFLREHSKGIIASSACLAGEIPRALGRGDTERARELVKEYKDIFPHFYIEIMLLDIEDQKRINPLLIELAQKEKCPLVLTNDVHYEKASDFEVQKVALLIQSKDGTIKNPSRSLQFDARELWFKSEGELDSYYEEKFKDIIPKEIYDEAKANTLKIAGMCEGVKIDTTPKLPQIPNAEQKLAQLVMESLKARGLDGKPEYVDRLQSEYRIIEEKGFASYFLIMKEIIDHVRIDMKSIVGPGRGSGPGFLINYLLGLCDVDPLKYSLLSERFLSPHRGGRFAKLKFTQKAKGV